MCGHTIPGPILILPYHEHPEPDKPQQQDKDYNVLEHAHHITKHRVRIDHITHHTITSPLLTFILNPS